jgi:hypothetical protein
MRLRLQGLANEVKLASSAQGNKEAHLGSTLARGSPAESEHFSAVDIFEKSTKYRKTAF